MSLGINANAAAIDNGPGRSTTEQDTIDAMRCIASNLKHNGETIIRRLGAQVDVFEQARRGTQDGVAITQAAEYSLSRVAHMLRRVRALAERYASDTLGASEQHAILAEVDRLQAQIDHIAATKQLGGVRVFRSASQPLCFQVSATDSEIVSVATIDLAAIADVSGAFERHPRGRCVDIARIDAAIAAVEAAAESFREVHDRLVPVLARLYAKAYLSAADASRFRERPSSAEIAALTRSQIREQAAIAMTAQTGQNKLQLLRGI